MFAGIDIGGTKLGVCLGTEAGDVVTHARLDATPGRAPDDELEDCLRLVEDLRAAHGGDVAAWGVACPGPFEARSGTFLDPPNMPAWHGFALRDWMRDRVGQPAGVMNDANALALAESYWGAGRDVRSLVFLTMSTGMGAGLILDGRLYAGPRGFAGEVGHVRLASEGPVGFGKSGSVEGFLSGPGIAQLAESERLRCVQTGGTTALEEHAPACRVCDLAAQGDAAACRAVERSAVRLGELIALLADIVEPELVVLGTIGSAWPDLFIPRARVVVEREALGHTVARLRIEPSRLARPGDQSALAVARQCFGRNRP